LSAKVQIGFIELQVFAHATEDPDKVTKAIRNMFPSIHRDEVSFSQSSLKGHHGNPIMLFKTKIQKKPIIYAFIENLSSQLADESKKMLFMNIERHLDDKGSLFIRLDKQSALLNKLELEYEDPIRIQIKFNIRQKSTENMVKLCRELGLIP